MPFVPGGTATDGAAEGGTSCDGEGDGGNGAALALRNIPTVAPAATKRPMYMALLLRHLAPLLPLHGAVSPASASGACL